MKFEESSITGYLVRNLQPLTKADPVILAKYVVALLKKDKPTKELQKLCSENLVEFLGHAASPFTANLFQALEDGSIVRADGNLNVIKKLEQSQPPVTVGTHQLKSSPPKEDNHSTSSEPISDPEDKEVSDDDDDDRNHKHRKREARPDSFDNDIQGQHIRRPNRKRNKSYDNGHSFLGTDPQASDIQKEYIPTSERNASLKFDKRRSDLTPLMQPPLDLGQRIRSNQAFHTDPGPRFDFSASIGRPPIGRGRGRGTAPWSQHDSRFNPHDMLDFASQMASQGPAHPNLFVGTGLHSVTSTQNAPWGGFGFVPGMSNRMLDPLHSLGLQGTLPPTITPPLSLGMPRQRCRDFEERGFCLRGDMCPMEHGLNRIVVEDVQSLSQFNLPGSIPSTHALGVQTGSGPLPPAPASSAPFTNSKAMPNKSIKSEVADDEVKPNGVTCTSGGDDEDVYDPDQPLWNDRADTSSSLLRLPSPNIEDKSSWDADSSTKRTFRLSNGVESDVPRRSVTPVIGSQGTSSSVWGRIGSGNRSETGSRINNNTTATSYHGKKMKDDHKVEVVNNFSSDQGKHAADADIGSKATPVRPSPRSSTDSGQKRGGVYPKASRTLYVKGVPQNNNRRDALLSHFLKFGEVINVYIPLNSENAFVQFSKREEAEAALKAPDAVMGNRFIKLFWANHDRILDEGHNIGLTKSVQSSSSVQSQQPVVDGGKEALAFSAPKRSTTPAAVTPVPVSGPLKGSVTNGPKVAPPLPKKIENFELLEELRRKQESLAKKRDDFRRQLDKLEKQAVSIKKSDVVAEQAAKKHKVDRDSETAKAATSRNTNVSTSGAYQNTDKTLEKRNSGDGPISPSPKSNSTILQQPMKNIKQTSPMPAPFPNRFKLDNRSTSFRILPPLPADFAKVAVLKDHFSPFGVISTVLLEDPEAHSENAGSRPSENCSACITFATRHSAERAYQTGKCWEGHHLQFSWLTASSNSSSDSGMRESSISSTPKVAQVLEIQADPVTSGSSQSGAEKSTCSVISVVATVRNEVSDMLVDNKECALVSLPKSPVQSSQFNSTLSSHENCPSESGVAMIEHSNNVGSAL